MPNPKSINPLTGRRYDWVDPRTAEKEAKDLARKVASTGRLHLAAVAKDSLLDFVKFTMPHPEDPNDYTRSSYEAAKFHQEIAKVLEQVERGEITQLIFSMPPRHGKTLLATKSFAAWYSGRHPEHDVIVAQASDLLAQDAGADVRAIMKSAQFRAVFPDHKLRTGGGAKDNLQTTRGGRLVFAGRGGTINGRGAHCLVAGTMVESRHGPVAIENLVPGDEVLSYDIERKNTVWKKVEAVAARPAARVFRLTTAHGRVVEATGDHRFFAEGDWKEARFLAPGDRLVRSVREERREDGVRGRQAPSARASEFLLLERVLGRSGEHSSVWRKSVRALRRAGASALLGWGGATRADFLLGRVSGPGARGRAGAALDRAYAALQTLQRHVRAFQRQEPVLQQALCVAGAFSEDAERSKPALEGRGLGAAVTSPFSAALSRASADGYQTGRGLLRSVFRERAPGGSPYRRERAEQPRQQSGDGMPAVSREGTLFRAEGDFVRTVEDTRRNAVVYDIQVAETECFFANEMLTHNCLLIDDLYKDHEEARSEAVREAAWNWLTKVALFRRMGKRLTVITMTRWHSDDIIGRLTDPENPHFNLEEAKTWKIIRLPGVAEDDDPLGRQPGEALWPERYDVEYHRAAQRRDPLGFAALVQQRPTVADGTLFRRETIQYYDKSELPDDLRIYCASDHAVATGQRNDPSCFVKVGVDRQNNIYIIDVVWKKMPTDVAVEAMLTMASDQHKPLLWWAERGHISGSIGPFLRKRMLETDRYINIVEVTPKSDKEQRAQSIAARVAMGKVFFPKGLWWTEKAIDEMMAFPHGTHDDFCDSISYIGLGLQSQFGPQRSEARKAEPRTGSLAWMKLMDKQSRDRPRSSAGASRW